LDALKVSWANKFNDSIEYSEEEVERWLIWYMNKNEDIEDTLHQLSLDLKELENELFETKTKHEIMVSPMREYIEQWLRKSLVKITETDQQEVGNTIMPPPLNQLKWKYNDLKYYLQHQSCLIDGLLVDFPRLHILLGCSYPHIPL
jgi:hypothetical protein